MSYVQELQSNIVFSKGSMEFAEKSVDEMGEWLRLEKFSENTVQIFIGKPTQKHLLLYSKLIGIMTYFILNYVEAQ